MIAPKTNKDCFTYPVNNFKSFHILSPAPPSIHPRTMSTIFQLQLKLQYPLFQKQIHNQQKRNSETQSNHPSQKPKIQHRKVVTANLPWRMRTSWLCTLEAVDEMGGMDTRCLSGGTATALIELPPCLLLTLTVAARCTRQAAISPLQSPSSLTCSQSYHNLSSNSTKLLTVSAD